jgi:hypothetical protein
VDAFFQEWKQKIKASDLIFPDHTMKLFYLYLLPMQIDDNSKVSLTVKSTGNTAKIIETFEAENEHPIAAFLHHRRMAFGFE